MEAANLKKGMFFNPDPYVKLLVIPGKTEEQQTHHMKEMRSSIEQNTTNPKWNGQVEINLLYSIYVLVRSWSGEVKDIFWTSFAGGFSVQNELVRESGLVKFRTL